jgi:hypothetical protein
MSGIGNRIGASSSSWKSRNYITALSALTTSSTTQIITATIIGSSYNGVSFEYSDDEGQSFTEHGTSESGVYNATGLTAFTSYIWRARLFKGTAFSNYFSYASAKTIYLLESLLGYWKLDESEGNAIDYVDELVLTNYNTVTFEAGKLNNGINLGVNNTNKYFYLNNKLGMVYNTPKSISVWVKVLRNPNNAEIYSFATIHINTNPGNYLTILYTNDAGTYKLHMNSLVSGSIAKYTKTLTVGTWYHVVAVYDPANNYNYLYVDGVLCLTTNLIGANDKTAQNGGVFVGQLNGGSFASACIDELGVWGKALVLDEVKALYNFTNALSPPFDVTGTGIKVMSDVAYSFYNSSHAQYDPVYKRSIFGLMHNAGDGNYNTYLLQHDQVTGLFSRTLMNVITTRDDHNEPGIAIRNADKKIVIAYRKYAEKQLGIKVSVNPCDISSFGDEVAIAPAGNYYHYYPQLYEVPNGDLHLFFSYYTNYSKIGWVKSTDGGSTWSVMTGLCNNNVLWYYILTYQDPNNKNLIHFIQCPHPVSAFNPCKITHYYYNSLTNIWSKSDGTDITANIPFDYSDGSVIHSVTAPSQLWLDNIIVDSNGYPRVLFTYYDDFANFPTRKYQMYSEWNGLVWSTPCQLHQSCFKNIGIDAQVNVYMPLATFDKLNPDRIFASKEISVGGQLEMYLLTRVASDNFTSEKKSTSINDQWRPVSIPSTKFNVFRLNKKSYNHYNGPYNQDLIIDTL